MRVAMIGIAICLLSTMNATAVEHLEPNLNANLRGFALGMSEAEALEVAESLFKTPVKKHCDRNDRAEPRDSLSCMFTMTRGMQEPRATWFTPADGTFTLANEALRDLDLEFYRGRLRKVSGKWMEFEFQPSVQAILHAFGVKFGKSLPIERLPIERQVSEVYRPISRVRHVWRDSEVEVSIEIDSTELRLVKDTQGKSAIEHTVTFEMTDMVTDAYIWRITRAQRERSRVQFERRGLGM